MHRAETAARGTEPADGVNTPASAASLAAFAAMPRRLPSLPLLFSLREGC